MLNVHDTVYRIYKKSQVQAMEIMEIRDYGTHKVFKTDQMSYTFFNHNIGKTIFTTKEEAEKCLNNMNLNAKKKEMLKAYELELNEKLGTTNIIIK